MIIDLSVSLDSNTPAYPGNPRIEISQDSTVIDDGYLGHTIRLGSHTGTHIDAPAHMIEAAATLGAIGIETFVGKGTVLDAMTIEAIDAAGIDPGDIVLFNTGAAERYYDPTYFTDYPVMSSEVADHLIAKGVKLVGLDTCSADNADGFPVHKKLLGAGIPIIENLCNLASLAESKKAFTLYALPLKLNIDGAPARVIAVIEDGDSSSANTQDGQ